MSNFDMSNYIDVKTKIQMFCTLFPEGSLQFEFKGTCPHNPDMIWGIAYAYREPNDPRPGMGTAQELGVGKTSFTRGSELQNLESSCWGRAISALGIGLEKGIATLEEVASAIDRGEAPAQVAKKTVAHKPMNVITQNEEATAAQMKFLFSLAGGEEISDWKEERGLAQQQLTKQQASDAIKYFQTLREIESGGISIERNK